MGTAAKKSGFVANKGRTASRKSTPALAIPPSSTPMGASTLSASPMSKLLKALDMGNPKRNLFRNTDQQLFVALLKSWGFTPVRKITALFDFRKEYLCEFPKRDKSIVVYALSGGPMVVFAKDTGKFLEWA
jgi:hypothetical protein